MNGERGILKYRGYLIEVLATKSTFIETAYLLIFGELPNPLAGVGIVIIMGAGLYVVLRERASARDLAAATAPSAAP